MSSPLKNILRRVERMPMMVTLAGVVAGIISADCLRPALWVVAVGFLLSLAAAYRWRRAMIAVCIVTGMVAITLRRTTEQHPTSKQLLQIEIDAEAHHYTDTTDYEARIIAWGGTEPRRGSTSIRLTAPTSLRIGVGDRVVAHCRLYPFNERSNYGGYMLRVGIAGRIYLDSENIISISHPTDNWGTRLRQRALQHLERLTLSDDTRSIIRAMSIGECSDLSTTQRRWYVRSGGAHLLAVSGLHIGFLYMVLNILLLPLVALRNGQLWRSIATVAGIWLYASMVGLSPSVVRAAIMFSIMQLATNMASRRDSLNTLCFAAVVMLVWDARAIYDAGFLLSVSAVAAITEWAMPLRRLLLPARWARETGNLKVAALRYCVRWFADALIVSLMASLVTIPLAATMFGVVSLWSVVVGWAMIALCSVAVSVALIWMLCPLSPLTSVVSAIVEFSVGSVNAIARWCADSTTMNYDIEITPASCIIIYAAFALFTLALWSMPTRNRIEIGGDC